MNKRLQKIGQGAKKPLKKLRRKHEDVTDSVKLPLITNETIAEHREEVLAGARKYIYPLQHSKHRIVILSSIIFAFTLISFFVYSSVALYRLQHTSTFIYRVTQIVPFPVARVKGQFVSYENYLFELRHYMHYYETQQKLSFGSNEGQRQLQEFKQQAMDHVIQDAYVKALAKEQGVSVSAEEVDKEIAIVREQNRLGTSDQVFEDVLRDFWGWSVNDFRRSLKQQLLARKVASKLDTAAQEKIRAAQTELQAGADFAEIAKKYSDDEATREAGGDYGILIDAANRDISAKVADAIFSLQAGQYSDIIDTGYSLEIVKTLGFEGDKARAAHIQVNLKPIEEYINPLLEQSPPRKYVTISQP